MGKPSDRDSNYMHELWGTTRLITDYEVISEKKVLQEVLYGDSISKKHDFTTQNQLHEQIRNDDDYDDWEYGTEPTYNSKK